MKRANHAVGWAGLASLLGILACGGSPPPAATAKPAAAEAKPAIPAVGIYVTNETSGDLTVIDAATLSSVATMPLGRRPRGIASSPDRTTLYVALSGSPSAPPGVDEKTLPPPDRSADGIGVVDIRQGKLIKVLPSGPDPEQVAVSQDGSRAYVPSENGATLSVIDTAKLAVTKTIALGTVMRAMGTAMAADGKHVYVTTGRSKMLLTVHTATNDVTGSIEVGTRPWGMAIAPDGRTIYTANGPSNDVSVVDLATSQVTKKIPVGRGPWGVAVVAQPAAGR